MNFLSKQKVKKLHPEETWTDNRSSKLTTDCFLTTGDGCPTATVLTAVDIQTGFGSAVVTPSKGRDQHCITELKRFVFEIGRTYGIIQYDPESSLKALVSETLTELGGMSMRATPRNWKQAHGFVGKSQQNFYGQARAIRPQLQERYNVQISVQHAVYPWIVKDPQFTLNRFLTHSYGNTSYFRRWGKNYSSTVCEFGETVLFRYSGKLKDKGDTAWSTGIWLGHDTEADEYIVSTGTGIIKVRTIKRQVPSKQWDQELFLKLQATPWDPKAKQVIDTSFVLPPTLTSTGRVREPPGLERETQTGTEDLPMEETHETVTETQDDLKLETLETTETETRLPPETRVRNEKRTAENQELPEDLLPDGKRLTIAAIGIFSVTLKDGTEVPVAVNENTEEKQTDQIE